VAINDLDYLLYSLLDSVDDSYFPVLEHLVEQVDTLEQDITDQVSSEQMSRIHELRGQLLSLRRSIRPHREMINELVRDSIPQIHPETRVHLRDCYDHVIQVVDAVDTYREVTSDLRDFYLSSVSNSMNEVMKLLTIISTIFIPLSFVAGVYGMNFDPEVSPWNMPELKWRYGYFFSLAIMATMAGGLLVYFRRRRWICESLKPANTDPIASGLGRRIEFIFLDRLWDIPDCFGISAQQVMSMSMPSIGASHWQESLR
ncbi:MAG: magnesium/cobalt transporter CorA, partial [Pirellula sp.]